MNKKREGNSKYQKRELTLCFPGGATRGEISLKGEDQKASKSKGERESILLSNKE